jgi:hypothetical protein
MHELLTSPPNNKKLIQYCYPKFLYRLLLEGYYQ